MGEATMMHLREVAQQVITAIPTGGGFRHIFLKYPPDSVNGRRRTAGTWVPDNPEMLARIMAHANDARADAYIMLNPSCVPWKQRPSSEDIIRWQYILLDIDPNEGMLSVERQEDVVSVVVDIFRKYGIKLLSMTLASPVIRIVDSGRGMQFWLRLDPTYNSMLNDNFTEVKPRVRQFLKRIAEDFNKTETGRHCHVDQVVADPTRLARLPGTRNSKTGRDARFFGAWINPHSLVWGSADIPTDVTLRCFLDQIEMPPDTKCRQSCASADNLSHRRWSRWQCYLPYISNEAADFLMFPTMPIPWGGGRNNMAYRTMLELLEAGMPVDDALHLVDAAAQLAGLDATERRNAIRSATKRFAEKFGMTN